MYVNAKMIPVETVPGIRRGEMQKSSGGGEPKSDIFDTLVRTFVNATMHLPQHNNKKTKKNREAESSLDSGT
jgi:hypothetical protein